MVEISSKITPRLWTVDEDVMHSEPVVIERFQIMVFCDLKATLKRSDLLLFSFNLLQASMHQYLHARTKFGPRIYLEYQMGLTESLVMGPF